ncbi:MAG: hypothetical protein CVV13_05320 [Gammaproteobacteria bacterium HGW-Gammaproteobacteria-3]|nr:MAG: hypothetical protein CVV13_05320 [Gammaproteobacteria bacterium HGW-Gammaproteobacteria-3]
MRILLIIVCILGALKPAWALEVSGYAGIESLGFIHDANYDNQHNHYLSGVIQPEIFHEWDDGRQNFAFVPFYRYSQHDSRRTHFDIRELSWLKAAETWELRVGIRKVFWGVAESQHLVDIVNQTDWVENIDGEDKLGQPMINLALIRDWGTLDLFVLPGFRERRFPGEEGRNRPPIPISMDHANFSKDGFERQMAYAMRWSASFNVWDIGLSHFYGTSRDPLILLEFDPATGKPRLIQRYDTINQTGLDVQMTEGNWLWKLEAIVRSGQRNTYFAGTGGFEYTFFGVFDTGLDLGLLAEYLYDSRGRTNRSLFAFEDDFLVALRFGFNDAQSTEILAGVLFDRNSSTKFYSIEASRRIAANWKLSVEARLFGQVANDDQAFFLKDDDHIRAELTFHF